jgi:hypothetical protein
MSRATSSVASWASSAASLRAAQFAGVPEDSGTPVVRPGPEVG